MSPRPHRMRFNFMDHGNRTAHDAIGSADARHLSTRYHGPDDPVLARVKSDVPTVEQGYGRCHECRHQVFYSRAAAIQFPMLKMCLNCVAVITPKLLDQLKRINEEWRMAPCTTRPCPYA